MSLDAGTRLGSFEIVAFLGRGGMGAVYRARDRKLGRAVALKVLERSMAADPERLRRFEQEARAASALNHPNLVHIYDVDEADGVHYIAMELVEGETLRETLAEAPLGNERMLELARQIAEGLAKAHEAGIVHRDLKPENIMVTADGFVKILDFGLAKLTEPLFSPDAADGAERDTVARTRHGMLLGTVEYMSPEQAAGKTVDFRSDQFSLGLILYEMATGTLAFRRDTAAQTLASIIESDAPALDESNSSCPPGFARIVERCLAKTREERFDTTKDLVASLKDLQVSERVGALSGARRPVEEASAPPSKAAGSRPPSLLGEGIAVYVGDELRGAMDEVGRELRESVDQVVYQIRTSDGRVRSVSEKSLRKRLRRNRFSGVEMVRRVGEDAWAPLQDSRVYREELGDAEDPVDARRRRKIRSLAQHACIFVTMGVVMTFVQGQIPTWMGFWGIGLAVHAVDTLPAALATLRRRRRLSSSAPDREEIAAKGRGDLPVSPPVVGALLSDVSMDEVRRVKELLARRGGEDAKGLLGEVDGIVHRLSNLAGKQRDLEEQTSEEEREKLQRAEELARARVESAEGPSDRKLFQRRLDVIRTRRGAIDKALVVLSRLQVRREVAEHQIKQLRLDLSRAEASSASVPELTSRLQDIRHEVDATEAVDEAIAQELLS